MKADHPLRILFVEDLPSDVELAERELRKEGVSFTSMRVETEEGFLQALKDFRPDLIISDYAMPEFDGMQALKLSREHDGSLPFILLTGSMNEETAVACMKAGATDYIIKEHIRRLPMAAASALERKKTRLIEKETEKNYRELFESIMDVFYRTDIGGKVLIVSPSVERLLGYAPDEVIGKKTAELYIYPDEWHQFVSAVQEQGEVEGVEAALRAKDGSVVWVSTNAQLYRDDQGNILGVQGITRDITERKRTEIEIRANEERFRAVFEHSTIGKSLTAPDGHILQANKAFADMIGYTIEEIQRLTFEQITHPDDVAESREYISSLVASKQAACRFEKRYLHKNGSIVWVDISTTLFHDEKEAPLYFITSIVNITERKRADAALQESEELFRKVFEDHTAVKLIIDPDTGDIIDANKAAVGFYGWSHEQLIRMKIQEINALSPQEVQEELEKTRNNKQTHFEFRHRRADGSVRDVDVLSSRIKVNKKYLLHSIIYDITERRLAEEKLQQTLASLRTAVRATIQVIISTVEARDPYTANHQIRVADLARAIATEMKFSPDRIEGIRIAASIHDLGKLSVPAEILSKPTKLTETEFSLIKEHARKGYNILKNVESSWPLAEIVYQHHERMDGSGYPRNLKGDEILMEARILAVCDVVESMASHRPYRAALGIDAALKEIEDNRGVLYDADVGDACLRLFREKDFQFNLEGEY